MKLYSTFHDQLGAHAYSKPAPTIQPVGVAWVLLNGPKAEVMKWSSPAKATPPLAYSRPRSNATPMRPATVASQSLSVCAVVMVLKLRKTASPFRAANEKSP